MMNRMKRFLSLTCALTMLSGIVGCFADPYYKEDPVESQLVTAVSAESVTEPGANPGPEGQSALKTDSGKAGEKQNPGSGKTFTEGNPEEENPDGTPEEGNPDETPEEGTPEEMTPEEEIPEETTPEEVSPEEMPQEETTPEEVPPEAVTPKEEPPEQEEASGSEESAVEDDAPQPEPDPEEISQPETEPAEETQPEEPEEETQQAQPAEDQQESAEPKEEEEPSQEPQRDPPAAQEPENGQTPSENVQPEPGDGQSDASGNEDKLSEGEENQPEEATSSTENENADEEQPDSEGNEDDENDEDEDLSNLKELLIDDNPIRETVTEEESVRLVIRPQRTEKILLTVILAAWDEIRLNIDDKQLSSDETTVDEESSRQTIVYILEAEADKSYVLEITAEKETEFSIQAAYEETESPEEAEGEETEEPTDIQADGKTSESDDSTEDPDASQTDESGEQTAEEEIAAGEAETEDAAAWEPAAEESVTEEPKTEETEPGDGEDSQDAELTSPQGGGYLVASVSDCTVIVQYGADALFPETVTLSVEEILPGTGRYAELTGITEEMLTDDWSEAGTFQRVFDITFLDGEQEIEPAAPIQVDFRFETPVPLEEDSSLQVVHVDNENNAEIVPNDTSATPAEDPGTVDVDGISFASGNFSPYVVFQTKPITSKTIEDEEHNISITYGRENGIPENSQVSVTEIEEGTETYETFRQQLIQQLNLDESRQTVLFSALYDITILDENNREVPIQEDTTVTVTAELPVETARTDELLVVHFDDNGTGANELEATTQENVVTFETGGFSVYGFAYTVDYVYEGCEYHMQGESSMLLSELFAMLEIPENAAEAEKVVFSNPDLIRVERTENDWLLTSLKPFLTEESLTITLEDGRMIRIVVTDDAEPWEFADGVLTIHDQTALNYSNYTAAPWYNDYRNDITSIIVDEGITAIPAQFLGSSSGSTNYYSQLETVTLPESIATIGNYAFRGCSALKSVNIPEGLTKIGDYTFYYCSNLQDVTLPDSLTNLGNYAFYYCSALESVNIPEGLTKIGDNTFYYCSNLQNVTLPDSLTSIGSNAFSYCSNLQDVALPDSVTSLGSNAFSYCSNLQDVTLPDNLMSIGDSAFFYCGALESIDIPESVTNIGQAAFRYCNSLTSVHIPDASREIIIGSSAFRDTGITSIQLPEGLKTINSYLLRNCVNLKSVMIPSTVTSINANAFNSCNNIEEFIFDENNPMTTVPGIFQNKTKLKKVVLPQNLNSVPGSLFSGCTSLETVEMSDMVQTIENNAFYNCSKLVDMEMPQYLTTIGSSAFYNTGLSEIELPPSVESMGEKAFQNCKYLESADLESTQLTKVPDDAFNGCSNLETVTFPEGLTSIGSNSFANCPKLIVDNAEPGVLNIPGTVTEIKTQAFQGCNGLTKVVIPDSVTALGDKAFLNCSNLEDVTVGAGITTFPSGLFMNASKLRRVSFASNDSITAIPNDAFNGCSQLEEFIMPCSVETIGNNAFTNCSKLTGVEFPATLKSIGSSAYSGCTGLKQTIFSAGDEPLNIASSAFKGCTGLTEAAFPETLKNIGDSAYTGCSNLTKVTFEDGDYELDIGKYAFKDLYKLTNVDFPANLKSIGESAFENDTAITAITIPDGEGEISIGSKAFAATGLKKLTETELPDRVTEIGTYAFWNCKQLTEAALPDDITKLDNGVFNGCTALTSVTLNDNLKAIGESAFSGCTALPSIILSNNVETIETSAFSGCTKLKDITFNDHLKTIGKNAFSNCGSVTELFFPSSLESIGVGAFNNCDGLSTLTVPGNVKSINDTAFNDCDSLTDVTIDQGVETLGSNVFGSCDKLTSVNLADSVSEMGTSVFQNCTFLNNVRMPAGITTLPNNTFYGCTRLTAPDFTACTNLTTIGDSAFYNCENLPSVDLTPCTNLNEIKTSAFSGCKNMTEAKLPDSVAAIGANAFNGCVRLKTLIIPENTTDIGANALTGCQSLENLIWDARNGAVAAFSSGTHFTLTLGEHVDTLTEEALTVLCDGGANTLAFQGENDLTLPDMSGHGLPRPLNNLGAGQYHADTYGALYKVEDGKATLVYVPDGLTEYTIPMELTADDGSSISVTGVGTDALYAAQALVTLGVEAPENVTKISSGAFANARNLERVGGKTYKSEAAALFANAEKGVLLFDNTKLLNETDIPLLQADALQYGIVRIDGQDPYEDLEDIANGWPDNISVKITQASQTRRTVSDDPGYQKDKGDMSRDANGTYLAFTGDPLTTTIEVSNPASEEVGPDKIRVYFKTDEGCCFPDYDLDTDIKINGQKVLPDGTTVNIPSYFRVKETNVPGVRYYEIDRPENGVTISFDVTSNYPSPNSAGGDVTVWAAYIPEDKVEDSAGKAMEPVEKRQVVNRTTIPDPFHAAKTASSTSALVPAAEADGRIYIPSHSYTIDLRRDTANSNNPYLNNEGKDYITSADVVDKLVLPEAIILNPTLAEEIKNNRITTTSKIRTSSGTRRLTYTLSSPTYGTIFTFEERPTNENYLAPVLSLTEDEKSITLTWHVVNKSHENYLDGGATTYTEIPVHKVTMTVYGRVLCVDPETVQENTPYTIRNQVDITEHYNYSGSKTVSDDATYTVNSGDAKMTFTKSYDSSSTNYRGEYRPYTLTLKSTGILPLTLNEMDEIVDVIDTNSQSSYSNDSHYIDASGIWQMFSGPSRVFGETPLNDLLTLTINYAHLYGGEGSSELAGTRYKVITDKGTESTIATTQANTSTDTEYSGMSNTDPHDLGAVATFVFSKNEQGQVQYTLNRNGENPVTGIVSGASDIQALFDRYGFFVTRKTRYTVDWDLTPLGSDFSLPAGDSLVITIPTRLKDVFMRLETDTQEKERTYYYTDSTYGYDYIYNRADIKLNGTTKTNASSTPSNYRDAYLYKSVSGVNAAKQIFHYEDDAVPDQTYYDVVQYTVNPQHRGSAGYDLMPLTDHMTNRQALLAPVAQNAGQSWAEGLEIYTLSGTEYYLLTREGIYNKVWTGDRWADHVEVKPQSGGRYDTKIFWYLTDYKGEYNKNIQYKARIWMNDLTGAAVGSPMTSCTNECWLGDHQAHRLYDRTTTTYGVVQADAIIREWSKRIVDAVGDTRPGYDYCNITRGKQVIYRLRFANDQKTDFTLTGADFFDVLPSAVGFTWEKDVNVSLDYVNFDVTGPDQWKIEKYTGNNLNDEYRIKWDDTRFSMTCTDEQNGVGYIYVTVKFPTDTAWDTYVHTKTNTILNNTLHVKNTSGRFDKQYVRHDLADKAVVRLQKGVYATAMRYADGRIRYKTADNSRTSYENGDVTETRVYYYITLHNGGYTNLYLTPLQDVLPRGFKLVSVTQAYYNYSSGNKLASVTKGTDGPSVKYPDSLGINYTTQNAGDHELVTITLKPGNQYNDFTGQREYYLTPGQAAVMMMECSVDGNPDATDDDATNVVAMPYRDFYHTGLFTADSTSSPTAVNNANPAQNNGGCDKIDNVTALGKGCTVPADNTTQWLCSEVTLRRGDIRPGINKYLVKSIKEANGQIEEIPRPVTANPQDKLIWSVTGMNSGERSIVDYAITDVLPSPYNFVGEVCYRQKNGIAGETAPALATLFTIERGKVDANGQAVEDDSPDAAEADSSMSLISIDGETVPLTIGAGPTELHWHGHPIQVRIDLDEAGCEVLSIRFPDKAMSIPSGGEVELTYTTKYIMEILFNAVMVNYAYLTPLNQAWDGNTNHGNSVNFASPYSDAAHNQSVTSNDQIVSSYGGSTTSVKAIREKEKPDNATDSTSDPNYITVQDKSRVITYTLSVKNTNMESIRRMTLIDNLPEVGDHTVFNTRDKRNSAFRVRLDKDTDFKLWVVKANGEKIELERGKDKDYQIQYSDKTVFTTSDWNNDNSTEWQEWNGPMESTENVRSVRLVFHDKTEHCERYQAYSELFMEFDAQIDEGAQPGDIAYNGFGYNFTLRSGKRAEASPRLVGVRIPDLPHVKKLLVNGRDDGYYAKEELTFQYVLYKGTAVTPDEGETAIEKIRRERRDYATVSVTVSKDHKASETDISFNHPDEVHIYREDGYISGEWVMVPGEKYTLLELPAQYFDSVSINGKAGEVTISRTAGNSYTFTYNSMQVLTLESVNRHDDWSLRMQKQDQYQRPVSGAVFAVYSNVEWECMAPEVYESLEGKKPPYEPEGNYTGYKLMAIRTTDGSGSFQLDELSGETYICVEQSVPSDLYTLDQTPVEVTRENKERLKLVPVVNQYKSSGESSLQLTKHMQGRPLAENEFTFRIEPYDPIARKVITEADKMPPMPETSEGVANDADGVVVFGPFKYETKDIGKEYCYRVTEMIPAETDREENVIYDGIQGIVRAIVTDNGEGSLSAEWTYTRINERNEETEWDGIFRNAYASQTNISIPAEKDLRGKNWEDERFTFHLSEVTDPSEPKDESMTVTDSNTITFDRIYTHEDDGKTFEYNLYEDIPANAVGYKPNGERMKVVINGQRVLVHYGEYMSWTEAQRTERLGGTKLTWKAAGIFYDDTIHHIVVKVNYDETAKGVKADVTVDGQPEDSAAIGTIRFVNQFKPENIKAQIKTSKKVWWPDKNQYRLMGTKESFTIKLIPDDPSQPMPDEDTVTITRGPLEEVYNNFTVPLSWDALTSRGQVNEETGEITGEFLYTIVELKPDGNPAAEEDSWIDQIKYDATIRRVKIIMTGDPNDYSMTAGTVYQDAETGEWAKKYQKFFQNEYRTDPIGFPLKIEKRLNQIGASQGKFSFTLYDASDNTPVKTIKMNHPNGEPLDENVTVADLGEKGGLIDQETRNYYLLEDIPENAVACGTNGKPIEPEVLYGDGSHRNEYTWKLDGYTYDTRRINIKVTVKLDEMATYKLIPTVTYTPSKAIYNNGYEADGTGTVSVKKTIDGRGFLEGESYTFELTPLDGAPMRTANGEQEKLTVQASSAEAVSFDELRFLLADLKNSDGTWSGKNFSYTIHEVVPDEASVKDGENELLYKDATVEQKKSYDGLWTCNGITYAEDETVTLKVEDETTGQLSVTYGTGLDESGVAEFTNPYSAEGTGRIQVAKAIEGREFRNGDSFTFELIARDGAPLRTAGGDQEKLTVSAASANAVPFDELLFRAEDLKNEDGTWSEKDFSYTIHEVVPNDAFVQDGDSELLYKDASDEQRQRLAGKWTYNGIAYAKDQTVTINVKDNGDGQLSVTYGTGLEESGIAKVNNPYDAEGVGTVSVKKTIDGRGFREGESFTFELIPVDGAPLRTTEGKQEKLTVSATSEEAVSFDELRFVLADLKNEDETWSAKDFQYTIHEVAPDDAFVQDGENELFYKDATDEQKQAYDGKWTLEGLVYAGDQVITLHAADEGTGCLTVTCSGEAADPAEVTITNEFHPELVTAHLQADKAWMNYDGMTGAPAGAKVTFELYADGEATGRTVELDGTADAGLTDGKQDGEYEAWTATWNELHVYRINDEGACIPAGDDYQRVEYVVKETKVELPEDSYAVYTSDEPEEGAKASAETGKVTITNKQGMGNLIISKMVDTPIPEEEEKVFTFRIELADETINSTFDNVQFTDGIAEITVRGGESRKIIGLPRGLDYTVTELTDPDFMPDEVAKSGTIGSEDSTATFINTRKTADVWVTKVFSGIRQLPEGFRITNDYNQDEFTVKNAEGKGTEDDPYTWTIAAVPVGTVILFTETGIQAKGYTLTVNGTEMERESAAITVTAAEEKAEKTATDSAAEANESRERKPESIAAFTNIYTYHAEGRAELKGHKVIQNRPFAQDDTLKVKVSAAEGVKLPAVTEIDVPLKEGEYTASFNFGEIVYDQDDMDRETEKFFTYIFTETAVMAGTTPDAGTHAAVVKVTDDGEGHLLTEVTYSDGKEIEFVNPYEVTETKGTLALEKRFVFREAEETPTPEPEATVTPQPQNAKPAATPQPAVTAESEPEEDIPTTSISVRKIWQDKSNAAGLRPDHVTMTLNNGMKVTLNEQNGWQATIEDLPLEADGIPMNYYWKETEVPGYTLTNTTVIGGITIFVNELRQRGKPPEGKPVGKARGDKYLVIEEYETALGVDLTINHVGDCFD